MSDSLTRLQYSKTWLDAADFPTREYSETQVRADIQQLFTEIATYLNRVLLPQIESGLASGSGGAGGSGGSLDADAYLLKAGGQMTGPLLLYADPEYATEAATKQYVDAKDSLIKAGLDGEIAAIQLDIGKIQASVKDMAGNVTQITLTPEQIEALIQDALGNVASLSLTSDQIQALIKNAMGDTTSLSLTQEQIEALIQDRMGNIAKLIMSTDEIKALIQSAAGDGSAVTMTPEEIQALVENAKGEFSKLLMTSEQIQALIQSELGGVASLTMTEAEIAALVQRITGEAAQVTITPDDITAIVRNELNSEALMQILSDSIRAIVRDEMGEAAVTMTPEQIEAYVASAVGDVAKLIVSSDQIKAMLESAAGSSGTTMTAEQIEAYVQSVTGNLADLILGADEIKALIESASGNAASVSMTPEQIQAYVQNAVGKMASAILTSEQIQAMIADELGNTSQVSLTEAEIRAIVESVTGGASQVVMTPEEVTARIQSAINRETILSLLQDSIVALVRTEVAESGAQIDPDEIKLWVRTELDKEVQALTALIVTQGQMEAYVRDELGKQAGQTMTRDEIRSYVEGQVDGVAEQIISESSIISRVTDGLTEESVLQIMRDNIGLSVRNTAGDDGAGISFVLHIGDGETGRSGYAAIDGNVDVSGILSAAALYADYGDVASLAVDRLTTSRRIPKYLARNKTDDNFIRVQNQWLEFVAGVYRDADPVQAADPNGNPLYWEQNVEWLQLGSDGYPRTSDGGRVFTTTRATNWPVYVYQYNEQVKRSIRFETDANGVYAPIDTYGAGNAAGYNKGTIYKGTEGFDVLYVTPNGKKVGIHMGTDGYVDIQGQRRTTGLDFSGWDGGSFTETVEGGRSYTYNVTFDSERRPTRITSSDGQVCTITW